MMTMPNPLKRRIREKANIIHAKTTMSMKQFMSQNVNLNSWRLSGQVYFINGQRVGEMLQVPNMRIIKQVDCHH